MCCCCLLNGHIFWNSRDYWCLLSGHPQQRGETEKKRKRQLTLSSNRTFGYFQSSWKKAPAVVTNLHSFNYFQYLHGKATVIHLHDLQGKATLLTCSPPHSFNYFQSSPKSSTGDASSYVVQSIIPQPYRSKQQCPQFWGCYCCCFCCCRVGAAACVALCSQALLYVTGILLRWSFLRWAR